MAAARRLLTVAALALVLTGTASCVDTSGPVTPAPSTSGAGDPAGEASTGPSTVVTASASASAGSGAYPGTARAYAEAVLTAWRTGYSTRIADLTTPDVQTQLQTTRTLDSAWVYANCQGAAGSTYCQFVNGDGDAATLRLDNQRLGQAHAATEVKLDLTTYSNNAVEYVKAFIEGWRTGNTRRMAILANQSEVSYFTRFTPPGSYSTCATLAGGAASVRVFNPAGLNYTLTVSVSALGGKHAITGHAASPAACP